MRVKMPVLGCPFFCAKKEAHKNEDKWQRASAGKNRVSDDKVQSKKKWRIFLPGGNVFQIKTLVSRRRASVRTGNAFYIWKCFTMSRPGSLRALRVLRQKWHDMRWLMGPIIPVIHPHLMHKLRNANDPSSTLRYPQVFIWYHLTHSLITIC